MVSLAKTRLPEGEGEEEKTKAGRRTGESGARKETDGDGLETGADGAGSGSSQDDEAPNVEVASPTTTVSSATGSKSEEASAGEDWPDTDSGEADPERSATQSNEQDEKTTPENVNQTRTRAASMSGLTALNQYERTKLEPTGSTRRT